jgi:uncharacterized protein (TIGR03382 family)
VQITAITSTDPSFAVDTTSPDAMTTFNLPPGVVTQFDVIFTPPDTTAKSATIVINLKGLMTSPYQVKVSGTGFQPSAPTPRGGSTGCSTAPGQSRGGLALLALLLAPALVLGARRRRRSA